LETIAEAPTEVEADFEADVPVEIDGQDEGFEEVVESPQNILNLEDYGDYVVDLGGEYVPVSDLKGGGLRQQDYTRKTQEIAELRREAERALTLERALQANPQGTLQYLAEQHGVSFAPQPTQQANDWFEYEEDPNPLSPLEQRLAQIESRFEQEAAEKQVAAAFNSLKAKYGDDFNEQEVAMAATQRGIFDPNLLEMVYRDLAYEKITTARQLATAEAQAKAQQETRRRAQAAANAANVTSASGGAVGVSTEAPPRRPLTVREAAELAWNQLYGD
jgi:hypothetical protein